MRLVTFLLVLLGVVGQAPAARPLADLAGLAILPADTFAVGPSSGAFVRDGVRAKAQFPSQPVQGVSSLSPDADGWFWALSDNGFGSRLNSPDYLLRIYRMRPLFGPRRVDVAPQFISLRDPDRRVPFRIVNEDTTDRLLTGADLDPESLVRMPDGTFWIGDEFGPFLLHVAADGRLLGPPIEAPGVRSPDHPLAAPADAGKSSGATVGRSRGFEGLALDRRSGRLIALLEAGFAQDDGLHSSAFEFDPVGGTFTGRVWTIPFAQPGDAFTEFVADSETAGAFLTIERDHGHGPAAKFKRILRVRLGEPTRVEEMADLLNIGDPEGFAGGGRFTFPYVTTEALWPLGGGSLLIANDNNFPATGGRVAGERDPTEFILLSTRGNDER